MERDGVQGQGAYRIASPEQLNDYLRVTNPKIWVMLAAVVLLFAGLAIWGAVTSFESYVPGQATAKGGELVIVVSDANAHSIEPGMLVEIGDVDSEVLAVGVDDQGKTTASARADIPDGTYSVRIVYKTTQILSMLLN